MADTSKLRWALYEGAYQPALVFPAEELADTELPSGHTVVYLLGLDTNAVVPDAHVSDYSPRDTSKMSNPAAAVGVAIAQQILEGFQGGSGQAASAEGGPGLYNEDYDDDHGGTIVSDLHLLAIDGEDEAAAAADERRRHHEEKKLRKEAKRKAKEAKKAAKAEMKRKREDITSAPTIRHGDTSEDIDDEDDELLAAMAIEKKYSNHNKVKTEKSADDEEDEERKEDRRRHRKSKKPHAEGSWAALEEDLFSDEDDDDGYRETGADHGSRGHERTHHRSLRSGNRMGQALAALNTTNAAHSIPGLSGSYPYAQPFLMEIHYEYEQLAQEAANEGLLLTLQKAEVVCALDDELRQRASQKAFLEAALSARKRQSSTAVSSEVDALREAIARLETPLSVAHAVRRLVTKRLPSRAMALDRMTAVRARRAVQRRTRTFQDVTVVTLVDHLRSMDAVPREDGAEVMRRYIQQRRQHEELKSNFRGLSKTGFYAVPKPMEKWRRARDMMVLANVGAEAQKVLPTSYISQAHSTMVRRMKEHAEKRYDRMAVSARDGASFLDPNSFAGSAMPSSSFASPSPALTQQQRFQQQRLAASSSALRREAFFQFHTLRCDTETPVTVETVALNTDFAVTGLSQNVLASLDDLTASAAPPSGVAGAHVEDSQRTDDDMSQASFGAHCTAPSPYPFIFDSEPRGRRPQRQQRGSSMSGALSSASEGMSAASSRATSVGSVYSEANDDSMNGEKKTSVARRHRRTGSVAKRAMNGSANATAGGTSDWRTNAKRSIMEQLTLYCRGRGGKPAILSSDQCREIGRTLLDRAMRAEAERQGVSLAVQSNNIAAPFTKTTEQRLKKSVDHYLERRMAQSNPPVASSDRDGAEQGGLLGAGNRNGGVLPMPGEGGALLYDSAAVMRQRAVADTPVYEN